MTLEPEFEDAQHGQLLKAMSQGRFEEALPIAEYLAALQPDDAHYAWHVYETLNALERLEDALKAHDRVIRLFNEPSRGMPARVALMAALERPDEAHAAIEQSGREMAQEWGPEFAEDWRNMLRANVTYVEGGEAEAAEQILETGLGSHVQALVTLGQFDEAIGLIDDDEDLDDDEKVDQYLLVYAAARQARESTPAATALKNAIELLRRGTYGSRELADWLTSNQAPDITEVLRRSNHTYSKLVMLVAIGTRHESIRSPCFDLARKLNFSPTMPHLLIERIVGESGR